MDALGWKILVGDLLKAGRHSGQAMVELAVFGAIFLMILSALLSYGLKYYIAQRTEQRAFRTAMQMAVGQNVGTSSYMLIQDRHIPDPLDSFSMGSTLPFASSASVTRTNQMDALAKTPSSLSTTVYDIQTTRNDGVSSTPTRLLLKSSGWRKEYSIPEADQNLLYKYQTIYGRILGQKGGGWEPVDPKGKYDKEKYRPDRTCTDWGEICDTEGYCTPTCNAWAINCIRIIDPCVGETADYFTCYDIARKIVDVPYCTSTCQRDCEWDKDPATCNSNCTNGCAAKMHAPNQNPGEKYNESLGGAWYAADWSCSGGKCTFPVLEKFFKDVKWFGLQPDSESERVRDSSFRKIETKDDITTVESVYRQDRTERTFIKNTNLKADGYEQTHSDSYAFADSVNTIMYNSFETGNVDETWVTEKE